MISLLGVRTVDDSEDSPEQEDDDECERLFALHAGDALDEDEIERERRHDDRRIEQLHTYDTIRDAILTCARKPTRVSLIYRTETTAKKTRSSAIAEGPRDASCQLKSCQLPRNMQKLLIRQVLTKSMV